MREISIYLGSNDVFIGRRRCKTNTQWKKQYLILLFLTLFMFILIFGIKNKWHVIQICSMFNVHFIWRFKHIFCFATVSCQFSLELLFQWYGSIGYEVACKLQSSIVMENNNWCKHDNNQLVQFTNVLISTL